MKKSKPHECGAVRPKKRKRFRFVFDLDPAALYRIAGLPDEFAADAPGMMGRQAGQFGLRKKEMIYTEKDCFTRSREGANILTDMDG